MLTLLLTTFCSMAHAQDAEFDGGLTGGGQFSLDDTTLPSTGLIGLHGTVQWDMWGVEVAMSAMGTRDFDPRLELQRYFSDRSQRIRPFGALALGAYSSELRSTSPFLDIGPSLEVNVFPILDIRADARFRFVTGVDDIDSGAALYLDAGIQIHNARASDEDGDGLRGKDDACPTEPEDKDDFEDSDGCPDPDNDKDGVMDASDRCADEAEDGDGFEDSDGCPDPDNDGDGLIDTADKCAAEAEDKDSFEDEDGCPDPDNDKDGVLDGQDKCPAEMETPNGFRDRDGCADEVPAEVAKFSGRIEGIKFQTGKATLTPASKPVLDQAVGVLVKFDDLRLEVQGHTDDVGDDAQNLALSQARAEAVVAYMVSKGVAADRLVAKGYGETVPQVPNDSDRNRSTNRRVEFKRL